MSILVLNCGSSSIKFSIYARRPAEGPELQVLCHGEYEGIGGGERHFAAADAEGNPLDTGDYGAGADSLTHAEVLDCLLAWLQDQDYMDNLEATGHRVVHGGKDFSAPVRIDSSVLKRLEALIPLAPLHQPHNLAAIRILAERYPEFLQIACFDTAFHACQAPVARHYALPRELTDAGIQRYGFHGLSYDYLSRRLRTLNPAAGNARVIIAHLGNGASMCALKGSESQATSMGFTALEGLPMGTRCGSLDPGVILYLQQSRGMKPTAISDLLYRRSGLLGVSGISNDMRTLLASGDPRAKDAIDMFVYRINRELGSLAAALGGVDALVFSGGIGEHSPAIRARVCELAGWLGLRLDPAANDRSSSRIDAKDSAVAVWVIPTNEELMIASYVNEELDQ